MTEIPLIRVENVSKKFCRSLKRSMIYGMSDIVRNSMGLSSKPQVLRKNEFWAVKDISFSLKRGEALGIIGPNGSGKTTLLKMLNGIFWPDRGKIGIRGRVGALIEVGAGFHPLLTGRENIYLNASILGMSRAEISEKFDRIVEFADIGDFLDTPVKHYSSGMYIRLGFSIAIHSDPDILLIDEILAVGDIGFRRKCYNMIDKIRDKCCIILVSHNMFQIGRVCDQVIFMHQGDLRYSGNVGQAISKYYETVSETSALPAPPLEGDIVLKDHHFEIGENDLFINFEIEKKETASAKKFVLSVTFTDATDNVFAHTNSLNNSKIFSREGRVRLKLPHLNFNNGNYHVTVIIYDDKHSKYYSIYKNLFSFRIEKSFIGGANILYHDAVWEEISKKHE